MLQSHDEVMRKLEAETPLQKSDPRQRSQNLNKYNKESGLETVREEEHEDTMMSIHLN